MRKKRILTTNQGLDFFLQYLLDNRLLEFDRYRHIFIKGSQKRNMQAALNVLPS